MSKETEMFYDRNGVELQAGDQVVIRGCIRKLGPGDEIVVEPLGDDEVEYDRIACSPAMTDKVVGS